MNHVPENNTAPSPEEDNRRGYDMWADFYDHAPNTTVRLDDHVFPPLWRHVRGKRVLEIGCGTGRHTRRLLAQGNEVVGIDLSPGMLAVARTKLAGQRVTFIEADIMTYQGLTPAGFDVVVASLVLEHVSALGTFFARIAGFLIADGEVFLSELHPERGRQGRLAHFAHPDTGQRVSLSSSVHSTADIEGAAKDNGMTVVRREDVIGSPALVALGVCQEKHVGAPMLQTWILQLSP